MYCYSDNESVDYEALAIPGTSGESKCMLQLPISDSQLHNVKFKIHGCKIEQCSFK